MRKRNAFGRLREENLFPLHAIGELSSLLNLQPALGSLTQFLTIAVQFCYRGLPPIWTVEFLTVYVSSYTCTVHLYHSVPCMSCVSVLRCPTDTMYRFLSVWLSCICSILYPCLMSICICMAVSVGLSWLWTPGELRPPINSGKNGF